MTGATMAGEPPFDPAARCPKCGYDVVATIYVPQVSHPIKWPDQFDPPMEDDAWYAYYLVESERPPKVPNKLKRACARCGFYWFEACLENVESPPLSPSSGL